MRRCLHHVRAKGRRRAPNALRSLIRRRRRAAASFSSKALALPQSTSRPSFPACAIAARRTPRRRAEAGRACGRCSAPTPHCSSFPRGVGTPYSALPTASTSWCACPPRPAAGGPPHAARPCRGPTAAGSLVLLRTAFPPQQSPFPGKTPPWGVQTTPGSRAAPSPPPVPRSGSTTTGAGCGDRLAPRIHPPPLPSSSSAHPGVATPPYAAGPPARAAGSPPPLGRRATQARPPHPSTSRPRCPTARPLCTPSPPAPPSPCSSTKQGACSGWATTARCADTTHSHA